MTSQHNPDVVLSFNRMRKIIGIIGVGLPFILVLTALTFQQCSSLQPSISHYYYSIAHIIFVGALCMLGLFLIAYRSKMKLERIVSNVAGAASFGVAIFPTTSSDFINAEGCGYLNISWEQAAFISKMHYGFAAVLFACFALFCFYIFHFSDEKNPNWKKGRRNRTYTICGIIITISIAAIALLSFVFPGLNFTYSTIVFETTALLAFGFSWLLKGSGDLKNTHNKIIKPLVGYYR